MKLIFLLFLLIALSFRPGSAEPIPRIAELDNIHSILSGNTLFGWEYNSPIFNKKACESDAPFINQLNTILEDAHTSHDLKKEFKATLLLGQLYFQKNQYAQAETFFLKSLKLSTQEKEFMVSLMKLSELSMQRNLYLEALEYLRQAKQRALRGPDQDVLARILLKEGYCYAELKNFDIAENQYNKAYSLIEGNYIRDLYGEIFKHKGHLYFRQLNYLNALANFYKGLEFFEQDTVLANYAQILDYLGKIYYSQGNYPKALEYYTHAQGMYDQLYALKELGCMHYQKALVHLKMKNLTQARGSLDTCASYFSQFEDEKSMTKLNIRYAQLFTATHEPDTALSYLHKLAPIFASDKQAATVYDYYKQYTQYYMLANNADSALHYANKARAVQKNDLILQIDGQNLLSEVYGFLGDYQKAWAYKSEASALKDSLNREINSYEIKVLQSELELSQKKVVIENLNQERKIQNETIEQNKVSLHRQKRFTNAGITVSVFLGVFALLLGTFLSLKRRDNKKLFLRNSQIAQQKEEIELQSQHLQEINAELEKLSIIARETDNGIKIMNATGTVTWVNEGYTRMHGYKLEELQLRDNPDLLGEQANIDIQQLVNVWYGDKQPISFESLNKTKNSEDIWVQTTLTPILNEEGKIDRMIAIDANITRIKKAENEILVKNQDITSSISYAKRIQEAMMTPFTILSDRYKNSFYFHKPKSIVSGDFYWITYRHDKLIVACADSTGHGVPGAFMSMIGMSFLNKIVNEKGFVSPDIILNRMRMNIINHLHQNTSGSLNSDGMDMSVITIDSRNNKLEFAGAMNPITVVRANELIELKPDRMPVGYFDNEERPFSSTSLKLESNDQLYLYTDGYYDQFGGKTGAKMKSIRFKEILKKAAQLPANTQKDYFKKEFDNWRGAYSQVDDVLILGITID